MAFTSDTLSIVVQSVGGTGIRMFTYETDDSIATVTAIDYFARANQRGLRVSDLIFVSPLEGVATTYMLVIQTVDADGNATAIVGDALGDPIATLAAVGHYETKAAAAAAVVPADLDVIQTSGYSTVGVGPAHYKIATLAEYNATSAELRILDAGGRRFVINERRLSPDMAGGDPLGLVDSTAAFNAIFAHVRTYIVASGSDQDSRWVVDLSGGKYLVTSSINATGIKGWNTVIENGTILGECLGKVVLDLTGSRGYSVKNLMIRAFNTGAKPSVGILCAQSSTALLGFCDNNSFEDVSVFGYFTTACEVAYAQETTNRRHCRYWNQDPDGYLAVYQRTNAVPVSSDYQTLITGSASFVNNQWDNCDFRGGNGTGAVPTAILRGATTLVTCAAGHPFTNGQIVIFSSIGGMPQMNAQAGTVSAATATTFVVNIDSTLFSPFTSGGSILYQATKSGIYWSGGEQHYFDNCYLAYAGANSIQIDFPDTVVSEQLRFDFLFEGAISDSHFMFSTGAINRDIYGMEIRTYNTHARAAFMSIKSGDTGNVATYGGSIAVVSHRFNADLPLVSPAGNFAFYQGFDIRYPNVGGYNFDLTYVSGGVSAFGSPNQVLRHMDYGWGDNGSYTPTITAATGTITTATSTGYFNRFMGDLAYIQIMITVTTNGTGAGALRATLPSGVTLTADSHVHMTGRNQTTGEMLLAYNSSGTNLLQIYNTGNAYPAGDGEVLYVSGIVRITP